MTIEELKVIISAETAAFSKAINGVKQSVNGLTNVVKNTTKKMTSYFTSSATKISSAFTSMGKIIARVVSAGVIYKIGKQAIELASNIEEVQNVVEVSFGSMAAEVEFFAKKCAEAFGLSELSAKEYASSFMAMSNSMGVASSAAKTMSLQVAALAGDIASFYNISQDVAYTALKSIWTGETETLKKIGVVMSEANLKAYALANGITKSYTAMSQAEKVALRYNYVMSVTSNAQGDFTRTSSSWANQLRLLSLQWSQLMATMGTFLTQILLPIVQALNLILSLIGSAVTAFGKLFNLGSAARDMSEITATSGGLTDNLEEADAAATKLKRTIAGFDELEVLSDNSSSSSSSGAAIDFTLLEPYDFNALANQEKAQATLKGLINDFNKYLEEMNKKFIESKEKFKTLGKSFASSINELFTTVNWNLLGKTVGSGLNNIIALVESFRTKLDALQIGQSIAKFFNGLFDQVNWEGIANSFIAKVNNLFDGLKGFITTIDTSQYAARVNMFLTKMINDIKYEDIAKTIASFVNKAFEVAFEIVQGGNIKTLATKLLNTIDSIIDQIDWATVAQTIAGAFIQVFQALKDSDFPYAAGKAIGEALNAINLKDIINSFFEGLGGISGNFLEGVLGKDINTTNLDNLATTFLKLSVVFGMVAPVITSLVEGLGSLRLAFGKFGGVTGAVEEVAKKVPGYKKIFNSLFSGAPDFGTNISELKFSLSGIKGIFEDPDATPRSITWKEYFDVIDIGLKDTGSKIKNFFANIPKSMGGIKEAFSGIGNVISNFLSSSLASTVGIIAGVVVAIVLLINRFKELYQNNEAFRAQVDEVWGRFKDAISALFDALQPLWDSFKMIWSLIKTAFEAIKPSLNAVLDVVIQVILQVIDVISSVIQAIAPIIEIILNIVKTVIAAASPIIETIMGLISTVTSFLLPIILKIAEVTIGVISTIIKGITNFVNNAFNWISGLISKITTAVTNFAEKVKGIFKGIRDYFKSILNSIIGWVQRAINNIVNKFNNSGLVTAINKTIGTNIALRTINIPLLANGGVFEDSTLAIVGEASTPSNKEIVTPEALLEKIITDNNNSLVSAFAQIGRQIVTAIENQDMEVSIGDDVIARSAQRGNRAYMLSTGKSMF